MTKMEEWKETKRVQKVRSGKKESGRKGDRKAQGDEMYGGREEADAGMTIRAEKGGTIGKERRRKREGRT